MEKKFRKGEVVWAKVRGYPWWPALVKSIKIKNDSKQDNEEDSEDKELMLKVNFIGDDTHSTLPLSKIEKFDTKLEEFSKTKKRPLMKSIEEAKKIINGELTYDAHLESLRRKNVKSDEEESNEDQSGQHKKSKDENENGITCLTSVSSIQSKTKERDDSSNTNQYLGIKRKSQDTNNINQKSNTKKNHTQDNNFSNMTKQNSPKNSSNSNTQIDLNLKENKSKNININININVNNSTNNYVNITNISNTEVEKNIVYNSEIINNSDSDSETIDEANELKKAIDSILFYKINQPASSGNKNILTAMLKIEEKLTKFKNLNIYSIVKDFIPILTSFMVSNNVQISDKSTRLIDMIKDKLISEIFEFENDSTEFERLFGTEIPNNYSGELMKHFMKVEKPKIISPPKKKRSFSRIRLNSIRRESKDKKEEKPTDCPKISLRKHNRLRLKKGVEEELCQVKRIRNKKNKENKESKESKDSKGIKNVNKNSFSFIDNTHIKHIFKDFLESDHDFSDKVGIYSEDFYQNVYNKYNGLTELMANKRKSVCIKLLNILKLMLPQLDTDVLKKTVIFIEHTIRTKDPSLGNLYKKNLDNFYDRIKEILASTSDCISSES